jgi:8-hydroxy-5-deazaflavin:NADPH oxidoreductase
MKICIIGSGHIGAGLARAWTKTGHAVVFGARSPDKPELVELCRTIGASAATISGAVESAEVVVLAAPFGALDDVLASAGDLAGKIVVDCTNAVQKGMTLKYGHTTSAAEELQARLPAARVFKSFNAQGAENLAQPVYGDVQASNFYCGDDAAGRLVVRQLVEDVGFEAVDAGPLKNARLLEPMMLLWISCAQSLGTRDIAFKVLRR